MTVEVPEIASYLITIAIGIFPAKNKLSNTQVVYLKSRSSYDTILQFQKKCLITLCFNSR